MSPMSSQHISDRTFDFRSLAPSQQGGVSGEDMMSALEEFRRRRGVQEKVITDVDFDEVGILKRIWVADWG